MAELWLIKQTFLPSLLLVLLGGSHKGGGGVWCGIGYMASEVQTNISKDSPGSPTIHPHTTVVYASVNCGKSSHYGCSSVVAHSQNFGTLEG